MTYGIIKKQDGSTYISPIFALKYAGWKSEAIILDEAFTQIKKQKIWVTRGLKGFRSIYVIKNDYGTGSGDWVGLSFAINNKELFKSLQFGKNATVERFPAFKDYTQKIELPDYFELKTNEDISSLENVCFSFHDAYIRKYTQNDNDIIIHFDTTWECYITVIFKDVISADFEEKVGQILDSEIKKTDDGFSFVVTDGFAGWIDGCDYDTPIDKPFINCKQILWKIEVV